MPYNVVLTRSGDTSKIGRTCTTFRATQECHGNPLIRWLPVSQMRMRCTGRRAARYSSTLVFCSPFHHRYLACMGLLSAVPSITSSDLVTIGQTDRVHVRCYHCRLPPAGMPPETLQNGARQWSPSDDNAAKKSMRDDGDSRCFSPALPRSQRRQSSAEGVAALARAAFAVVLG